MKPILTLFLAASLLAASPLVAQARMAQPAAPEARKAAASNLFEIQSSRLALQRSRNPTVRRFAGRMIADHTALAARMNAMLARNGMRPPPPVLDGQQLDAHVQAVNLLSRYERHGANPVLRSAAANALPIVEQHLAMVRQMERGRHMSASRRYGRRS